MSALPATAAPALTLVKPDSRVKIVDDLCIVTFDRFDLDSYRLFLRSKKLPEHTITYDWRADTYTLVTAARFAPMLGYDVPGLTGAALPIASHLFDYQQWSVDMALKARRFSLWLDTGLGKMACALEWARQVMAITGGRVLILVPVVELERQYVEEAARFYGDDLTVEVIPTRDALIEWLPRKGKALGICTYHKFIPGQIHELRHVAGLVADECFTAGTPVDTPEGQKPIEDIRPGDAVMNATGVDYVVAVTQRAVSRLVELHIDNGQSIISSENHPYLTRRGWVRACDLQEGDELVTQPEAVRALRQDVSAVEQENTFLQSVLRSEVAGSTAWWQGQQWSVDEHGEERPAPLFVVWDDGTPDQLQYSVLQPVPCAKVADGTAGSKGTDSRTAASLAPAQDPNVRDMWLDIRRQPQAPDEAILQSAMLGQVANEPAGDQGKGAFIGSSGQARREEERLVCVGNAGSECRARPDRGAQSDEEPRDATEGRGDIAGNGPSSAVARWEGTRLDRASEDAMGSIGAGLGMRMRSAGQAQAGQSAVLPVYRHSPASIEDCNRSRRSIPQDGSLEGQGRTEGSLPAFRRVDRVALLEPGHPLFDGYRATDDKVYLYDLEIAKHPSFSVYNCIVHNSSILKTGGGTIKWNLIHSARGIQYKLSMTATPAPNEAMEYASQASFLEKLRSENEVIWTFFADDKFGNWRIKEHARDAFYRFLASWSLYMRNPAAFGFADILSTLPAPDIREERVALTEEQQQVLYTEMAKNGQGMLVDDRITMTVRSKLMQAARGFRYEGKGSSRGILRIDSHKPARVAEWTRRQVAEGRQTLIWTTFDEEGAILAELLSDAPFETAILDGSMSDDERGKVLARFRAGDIAVVISKPQLIGYGLNLQFVKSMAFSGFDDSFERVYQATRRAVRFGQTEQVRVFIPYVPELEGLVFSNIRRKEARFMEDVANMESAYIGALKELAS